MKTFYWKALAKNLECLRVWCIIPLIGVSWGCKSLTLWIAHLHCRLYNAVDGRLPLECSWQRVSLTSRCIYKSGYLQVHLQVASFRRFAWGAGGEQKQSERTLTRSTTKNGSVTFDLKHGGIKAIKASFAERDWTSLNKVIILMVNSLIQCRLHSVNTRASE